MAIVEGGRLRQISQNMQGEHTIIEEGFSHACQSTAVKDHLLQAVRLENKEVEVEFAFGEKLLLPDSITLNPLKVENLGDISIPVSIQDIQRLKKISEVACYGKQLNKILDSSKWLALEINSSKLTSTISDELKLPSLAMHHLGLPSELMCVQAKLQQLILYESGGHYHRTMEYEKEYGSFGTMILQLPVKGGHEGGRFKVEYRGKEKVYDNHKDSDRCFYVSLFYENCEHSMEPVISGTKLTLVFNLVWANAQQPIPKDFPLFLTALKGIKESLSPWMHQSADTQIKKIKNNTSSKETHPASKIETLPVASMSREHSYKKKSNSLPLKALKKEDLDEDRDQDEDLDEFEDQDQHEDQDEDLNQDQDLDQDQDYDEDQDDFRYRRRPQDSWKNQDEDEDEYCDSSTSSPPEDFSEEKDIGDIEDVLYFVLEEKYDENYFGFRRLRGKDRDAAQLFQCCGFLDVHLAVVTQTVTTIRAVQDSSAEKYWCECHDYKKVKSSNKISRWVDLEDMSRELSIDMNWKEQCVGPCGKFPTSSSKKTGSKDRPPSRCCDECYGMPATTTSEIYIQHFILVIWPKRESFRMYCRYGLHSLLQELEFKSSTRSLTESVQKATEDLRKVISFCSSDPWHMWNQTGFGKGEVAERLLRLCIDFRAREEGLALLKLLSADFPLPQEGTKNIQETFEGIKSEQVAKAIVEFECRVTGWSDCADLIEKMISPNRITQQLMPVIKLAHFFLNFDCLEGAKLVGDRISSAFINIEKQQARNPTWQQTDIRAYLGLIFALEANPKTSNQGRMKSFSSFFSKLESSMLCELVQEMASQASSQRNENSESCKNMFHVVCKALNDCDLRSPSIKKKAVVDLICCCFRTGNVELLRSFLSNIVRAHIAFKENKTRSETLLEEVISSPEILNLDLSSELGEIFMEVLVDSQLTSMKKETSGPGDPCAYGYFLLSTKLSLCFQLVIQSGKNSHLVDPRRAKLIASILAQLDVNQLTNIFTDILKTNSKRLKACPSYITMIYLIGNAFIAKFKKDEAYLLSRRKLLDVLDIFIESGVESLTQSLIKQVCANANTENWSHQEKYDLFAGLFSIPRVWEILDSKSKLIIMKTCGSVIQNWIVDIGKFPKRNEILNCIQFFFLVERNRLKNERPIDAQLFEPLIAKLPVSSLMDVVLHLHQSEAKTIPNIKNFPACFNFYRHVSRLFFTMEFVPLVKDDGAIRLLNLLLWLEDEPSWQSFATSVSTAFPSTRTFLFLRLFLKNPVIKQALTDSRFAFSAFASIVDNCSLKSASLKEPPFSWHQPQAVVPKHPEVEAFLRCNQESMTYMKFTGIAEARHFAAYLMTGSKGFSVSVTTSGAGKNSRCIITKTRKYYEEINQPFFTSKGELELLVKLRERLGQENLKTKRVTSDDVSVVPPPKRNKVEKK